MPWTGALQAQRVGPVALTARPSSTILSAIPHGAGSQEATMLQGSGSQVDARPGLVPVLRAHRAGVLLLLAIAVSAWPFLAWLATADMDAPLAQLVMPMSHDWSASTLLAVWSMWSVMMVAMMLPS